MTEFGGFDGSKEQGMVRPQEERMENWTVDEGPGGGGKLTINNKKTTAAAWAEAVCPATVFFPNPNPCSYWFQIEHTHNPVCTCASPCTVANKNLNWEIIKMPHK